MANIQQTQTSGSQPSFFASSRVGTVLTILSGLSFLLLGMMLPLVGKSGAVTVHAKQNFYAFLIVLLISLALAIFATISKMERRRIDKSPLPLFSFILCGLCGTLLIALFLGLLKI